MLRWTDRVFAVYFLYTSILAVTLPVQPGVRSRVLLANVIAAALYVALLSIPAAAVREFLRDWLPMALFVLAYREMGWFAMDKRGTRLEQALNVWDRFLFQDMHLREAVEATGILLPGTLELSYLLVYAVPVYCVVLLYVYRRRAHVDAVVTLYTIGLLGAYAVLPYFPSEPPRVIFPGEWEPTVTTVFRRFNQAIVRGYGIHTSVFPSAHVSGAFAAFFALWRVFGLQHWTAWTALVYAILVAVATVYGRYHYAADCVAGIAVSIAALAVTIRMHDRHSPS